VTLVLVDELLRDRDALCARIDRGDDLRAVARAMAIALAVAAALVGAAIGSYRGGVQIAYAAVKVPAVLLATAGLCASALVGFELAIGRRASPAREVTRLLAAVAFGALVLLAQAPLLLLAQAAGMGYHRTAVLMFGCFAIGGLASVHMLARGRARSVLLAVVTVFALVGAQVSWTMRPYLVRPRTSEVPFVRDLEGSLYDSVLGSACSMEGD
jgi:hypothetical protein